MTARLAEAHRVAQIALEYARRDPDDEDAQAELEDALARRDREWLEHGWVRAQ